MAVSFLTPLAALLAAGGVVPLLVFALRHRRVARVRAAIGLPPPPRRTPLLLAAALALVPVLLGVAAAQPVVATSRTVPERSDAELFVVIDTSRSMLASAEPGAPSRLARAKDAVRRLRDWMPEIPVGLASMTDRTLPHVFPTTDRRVLEFALRGSIGIEQPGPSTFATIATELGSLAAVPQLNYFSPAARKRVLVVLTDGESEPAGSALAAAFARRPRIETAIVRLWDRAERIYDTGAAEAGYVPSPQRAAEADRAAQLVRGRVYAEGELGDVRAAARRVFGDGPTRSRTLERERRALMPYVALAALVPLAFVLWRRNV